MLNFQVGTYGFFVESNMEYGTPPVGLIFFGLLENGVREVNLPPSGEVQFAPGEFAAETEAPRGVLEEKMVEFCKELLERKQNLFEHVVATPTFNRNG